MCIRDRSNRLQEIVRLGGEHYEKTEQLQTHKVHGENLTLRCGRSGLCRHVHREPLPYQGPVSYTHLDVYKRQVRLWKEIFQLVKENCSTEYGESTPQDDLMERLLRARKG